MPLSSPRVHLYMLEHHHACDLSFWLLESCSCARKDNYYLYQTFPWYSTLQFLLGALVNVLLWGIDYFFTPIKVLASGRGVSA